MERLLSGGRRRGIGVVVGLASTSTLRAGRSRPPHRDVNSGPAFAVRPLCAASGHDGSVTLDQDVLDELAAQSAAEAGGVPVELLGDFAAVLSAAVGAGTPVEARLLRAYRRFGDRAARDGVALRALLDLYLSLVRRLWPLLPAVRDAARDPDGVVAAGAIVLAASDDVVGALSEGHQLARRTLVRAQEAARREFIDDLLGGVTDVVGLLHRADGFGLDLSGPHAVITVRADRDIDDGTPLIARLERAIQGVKGDAETLLASKHGELVVVFAAPDRAAIAHVVERIDATLHATRGDRLGLAAWQLGVGRPGTGADGIVSSYREAVDALELARRLGLDDRVVDARDLLVYRVLLRDRDGLADLVENTVGELRTARGGAGPLLDTLAAWFACAGNAAATARELHLSVRAVTYRLERIATLTGLDPAHPPDRFALHVAALGARLLDWPGDA